MTGIESTQVGRESLLRVAYGFRLVSRGLYELVDDHDHAQETERALTDHLADINELRALVAGLRDDAHQRAVEAAAAS